MPENESPARREARLSRQRAYRIRHKERIALAAQVRRKIFYQANLEKCRARARADRLKFLEKNLARVRIYQEAHREELKQKNRAYNAKHKEQRRLKKQAWTAANRERLRVYQRAYRAAHPAVQQTANRRRRAAKYGTPANTLTAAQWRTIQEAQRHQCYYCGKRCKGKLTQDHILPLSQGGAHTLQNVIGACRSCNSKKHTSPPPTPVQPWLL